VKKDPRESIKGAENSAVQVKTNPEVLISMTAWAGGKVNSGTQLHGKRVGDEEKDGIHHDGGCGNEPYRNG